MQSCWSCWFAASPYLAVVLALSLWWLSWPEPVQPLAELSNEPIAQETLRFDEAESDDASGLQVTLIPAPNFSAISLSDDRKQTFIAWLLPLIAQENERILSVRREAVHLYGLSQQNRLSLKHKEWLVNIAIDYEVDVGNKGFDLSFWQNLLHRVDAIPPSLVLTQAAVESGWGTSRLAKDAHNFFGIMCFKPGCGVPFNGGPGEFRRFVDVNDSIAFYMRLINTKGAYRAARAERMRHRLIGDVPSGLALAKTLLNYSELGSRYIDFLLKIMRENRLDEYDGADLPMSIEVNEAPAPSVQSKPVS
ncbi:MAG: glucosaminidase domain-containing protein [Gammaproteobacteria bacterium]|nr:glucosaminidase domain-containing protein [Gammaproteobacteria bacterium]